MKHILAKGVALGATAALVLTACGAGGVAGGSGGDSKTIKVAYMKFGTFTQLDTYMQRLKKTFEATHKGITVQLMPIEAQENDYATKIALMNQSAATAPDIMYEDTFRVKSDVDAGYFAPLDAYTAKWSDWGKFYANAKGAGLGGDGKTYAIPMGTDTRALWYNKNLFQKAGLPVPWAPKTWQDVLDATKTIKSKLPGVMPLNVYSGKAMGEAASMQGFEMLLYGTKDTLYNAAQRKWITGFAGVRRLAGLHQGPVPGRPGTDTRTSARQEHRDGRRERLAAEQQASHRSGRFLVERHLAPDRHEPLAPVEHRARRGRDADPERPGARSRQHVGRLDTRDGIQVDEQERRVGLHRPGPEQGQLAGLRHRSQPGRRAQRRV